MATKQTKKTEDNGVVKKRKNIMIDVTPEEYDMLRAATGLTQGVKTVAGFARQTALEHAKEVLRTKGLAKEFGL